MHIFLRKYKLIVHTIINKNMSNCTDSFMFYVLYVGVGKIVR